MVEAIGQIEQWQAQFTDLPLTQALLHLKQGERAIVNVPEANVQIRAWGELGNLLDVAMLILKSGLFREESRGGHYRLDYPETLEAWQLHTLVQGTCWSKSPHLESVTHSTL
jgi:L-aspartate oxidase